MKKLLPLFLVFLFALAGTALAVGTHTVTLSGSGWIRIYSAGGLLTTCSFSPGTSQYWAKLTTPTGHIATLRDVKTVATVSNYARAVTGAWNASTQTYAALTHYSGGSTTTTYSAALIPIDFTAWYTSNNDGGGITPGTGSGVGGIWYTEVTAASDAFITCTYKDSGTN